MVGAAIRFGLDDPDHALRAAYLVQDLRRPRDGLALEWDRPSHRWQVEFPHDGVLRMEYRFSVQDRDGGWSTVLDPANPRRVRGPFGDKSVVELPGYQPPAWEGGDVRGQLALRRIESRVLRGEVPARVWSSTGVERGEAAPLLVVHDGRDYTDLSDLLVFLTACVREGRLPPHRAALLDPVHRDEHYSASAAYQRALVTEVLPALEPLAPSVAGTVVGLGASLGALGLLHAHRRVPGLFAGLFLQSGSFFRPRTDGHESGFVRFSRVTRFVGEVLRAAAAPEPVPVTLTCGTVEENLANNRAMAAALTTQGYDVAFVEHPDAHNHVSWRDALDPALVELLAKVWA